MTEIRTCYCTHETENPDGICDACRGKKSGMTLRELKQTIDEYIGLESVVMMDSGSMATLTYYSPTGIVLFEIFPSSPDGQTWEFNKNSTALPNSWNWLRCIPH